MDKSEFQKLDIKLKNVIDPRIVTPEAQYALFKTGEQINRNQFPPNSVNASQLQFSLNLTAADWQDRHLEIEGSMYLQLQVYNLNAAAASDPVLVWGRDITTCAFPFHELIQTATIKIGSAQSSIDLSIMKNILLRLSSTSKNMKMRAGPSALDTTISYDDGYATRSSPMAGYNDLDNLSGMIGNGCYYNWSWTNADGSIPALGTTYNSGTATIAGGANAAIPLIFQAPNAANNGGAATWCYNAAFAADTMTAPSTVYLRIDFRESLLLPTTIFDDCKEFVSQGYYNVQNIM